jgi:sugar phosphate isomerase/epimerase
MSLCPVFSIRDEQAAGITDILPVARARGTIRPRSSNPKASAGAEVAAIGAPSGAPPTFLADDASVFRDLFEGYGLESAEIQIYVDALGTPEAIDAAEGISHWVPEQAAEELGRLLLQHFAGSGP